MDELTIILSFLASILFLYLYLQQYSNYFTFRHHAWISILLLFLATTIPLLNFSWLNDFIHLRLMITSITYFLVFPLIFNTKTATSLFLTLNFILKTYCTFLFFAVIFAISQNVSLTLDWINDSYYYHLSHFLSYLLASLSIILLDSMLLKHKMKEFFSAQRLVMFIISIQIIMILNLAVISNGQDYQLNSGWYNVVILIVSISIFIIYFLTRLFTANMSYLIGYKYHTRALKKQLDAQLDHYLKYENQIQKFLKFRHDYDKTLHAISILLEQKNYPLIHEILTEELGSVSKITIDYHKYSNHIIIDAILNDYAQKFSSIKCHFTSTTYISLEVKLADLDLIKLFYNIMDNIYEAVSKVSLNENRLVTIESAVHDNFQMITFTNTMNSVYIKRNFSSNKKKKMFHGFGLDIIHDIVNHAGGFVTYKELKADHLNQFQLIIHLPLNID